MALCLDGASGCFLMSDQESKAAEFGVFTMKILILIIDPETGEIEVETSGWGGKGCHAVQATFAKAFGGTTKRHASSPNPRRSLKAFHCAESKR